MSWHDAVAFAQWAGRRLPTEAEWEYAARGGGGAHLRARLDGVPPGRGEGVAFVAANVWRGRRLDDRPPGVATFTTTPVGSFAPNALGLYDMVGNAWEWTADWYAPGYYARSPQANPAGPATGTLRVARGGSWFCSPDYCAAYSSHFRGASPPDHAFNNVGFRTAADLPAGSVE